jgi:hypothetical protein
MAQTAVSNPQPSAAKAESPDDITVEKIDSAFGGKPLVGILTLGQLTKTQTWDGHSPLPLSLDSAIGIALSTAHWGMGMGEVRVQKATLKRYSMTSYWYYLISVELKTEGLSQGSMGPFYFIVLFDKQVLPAPEYK